jgi:hypothetical protein
LKQLREKLEIQTYNSENWILGLRLNDEIREINAKIEICQEILFEIQLD